MIAYYTVYGAIISISVFFIYYFVLGDRLELAKEITKLAVTFGFFSVLLIINLIKSNKITKRIKNGTSGDEEIAHIDSRMKYLDRIVSVSLGLIMLSIPIYKDSLDFIDVIQAILITAIHYSWHFYLFTSRSMVGYSTISALTYLDKMKDYAVLLVIPIIVLILSILSHSFNNIDAVQALAVFIVAYSWHRYFFIFRN